MTLYTGKTAIVTGGASGQSLSRTSLHSTIAHSLNFPTWCRYWTGHHYSPVERRCQCRDCRSEFGRWGKSYRRFEFNFFVSCFLRFRRHELTICRDSSEGRGRAEFCACDVTSWASVCEVFQYSYLKFGERIDYVVCCVSTLSSTRYDLLIDFSPLRQFANAGIAQMKEMNSSDPTHFATAAPSDLTTLIDRPPSLAVIKVNLDGVLYCVHAALAYFRKQEKDKDGWRGKIVCTGSNA